MVHVSMVCKVKRRLVFAVNVPSCIEFRVAPLSCGFRQSRETGHQWSSQLGPPSIFRNTPAKTESKDVGGST